MKSSRALFATIGLAAVAASFLMLATPASAATSDVTFVTAADIGPAPAPGVDLPEGFFAAPALLNGPTDVSFSAAGFVLPADTTLAYSYGAGDTSDVATGLTIGSLNHGVGVDQSIAFGLLTADSLYLTLFTDGPAGDDADTSAVWTLTDNVGGTLLASQTLADIRAYLALNHPETQILLFGVQAYSETTFSDLSFSGKQYIFTPEPVVTAAPTTLSASALVNAGATITTSGFLPNEVVELYLNDGAGGGGFVGDFTANADGVVTATYRANEPAAAGDYRFFLVGSVPDPQFFDFTVTADAGVAAPVGSTPALAETGADAALPLGWAGGFVGLGLVLAVIAIRRRAQHSA